eukprot:538865_1
MQKILMTLTYACCCKRNKNMLVLFSLYIVTSLASAQNPTPINISLEEKISTATIWINELHYDNDGKDVGEFVEIAGIAHTTLGNYQIYLYSGADGLMYKDLSFNTGSIPKQQNGFGTVLLTFDQIQNGGNGGDGVALIYSDNNVDYVVQFLSYEGQFMANDGPANGTYSADIGIAQHKSTIVNSSLCLTGLGYQYEDFTWSTCLVSTPGAININQTITTPNPTESPSLNPTESPSLYSTQWPSKIPTNVPSTIPTQSPSATHILPITTPTATPIQSPTLAPTYALSDLQSNEIIETTNERNNQTFDGKAAPGLNTATVNYIIIIVSIIICCCIIVTILVIYIRILKQNEQRIMEKRVSKNMEITMSNISNLSSPTNKSINHDIETNTEITDTPFTTPGYNSECNTIQAFGVTETDLSLYKSEGRNTQSKVDININFNKNVSLINDKLADVNIKYENDNEILGNNNTATGIYGENINDDENEKVMLDGILSDIMEMDDLDPNKIHQIHVNSISHKQNNETESDE